MIKADEIFVDNILEILHNGTLDENPRPKYEDGTPAHTKYITQVFEKYDISNGEFPLTTLRPIGVFSGIKEIFWIYQDQTSDASILESKFKVLWWKLWYLLGTKSIGQRYGATVKRYDLVNRLLFGLKHNPFGRRHIINLWQENDLAEEGGLDPCAYETIWSVRKVNGLIYLDMTLVQRSSDFLTAGHINKIQYVALLMMVACHCGYEVGVFGHFVQNLHIYDRHEEQAKTLLERASNQEYTIQPILKLNVPKGTNFYDITIDDFELVNYHPEQPQLKFPLGI